MEHNRLLVFEDVGQAALAAVLPVEVGGHEDASSALLAGTLATEPGDLAVGVNLQRGGKRETRGKCIIHQNCNSSGSGSPSGLPLD